jgi:hypothetical protein
LGTEPIRLRLIARAAAVYFRQGDQAAAIVLSQEVVDGTRVVFEAEANHTLYTQGR